MKKILFIAFTLFAILTFSCTNDSANPTSQSSSIWRSSNFTETTMAATFEYYEVRFISSSTFELWVKRIANESPERVNQNYSYTIKDKIISIVYNEMSTKGTIEKSAMSLIEDGTSMKFVKI